MKLPEVVHLVFSTLESLGIPSMLVGSFASSSYGPARYTQDADLIVRLNRNHIDSFVQAFSGKFFVDRGLIEQALLRGSSFNIIHFQTTFKVDFFILQKDRYSEEAFSRRVQRQLDPDTGLTASVQTPEDVVLSKLEWYRRGGEISDSQWRDVINILKAQADRLDTNYLRKWSEELGLSHLLQRAREEAEAT